MENAQYQITCSFLEIYMETLTDLLTETKKHTEHIVTIREDPHKGVCVTGLIEQVNLYEFIHCYYLLIESKNKRRASRINQKSSKEPHYQRYTDEQNVKSFPCYSSYHGRRATNRD